MRRLVSSVSLLWFLSLAACSFDPSGIATVTDAAVERDAPGADPDAALCTDPLACAGWWDAAYQHRRPLTVATGANAPFRGYAGYTVRLSGFDTSVMVGAGQLRSDCADLRIVQQLGSGADTTFAELDRHVIGCDDPATEVRFRLLADIASDSADTSYYLYHGNPSANAANPVDTTNVYLWYDDATSDRILDYDRGRLDTWGSTNNWTEFPIWVAPGHYMYTLADDFVSSYRRPVDERDVLIEAEFMHTGCFPSNMVSGLVVRGIIASGTGGTETADHYYTSTRAHQSVCGVGYDWDGDIHETERGIITVDGPNPAAVNVGQWRKQALAAWGADPTNLSFWDADTPWSSLGWPDASNVQSAGTDADDHDGAGFAGLWFAQDNGSFRNIIIRRYVEPEPVVSAGASEMRP